MSVVTVNSKEFRDHQKSFLDLAMTDAKIILTRGKNKFLLTSISDDDLYFTPGMLAKIDRSLQQAKEGKVKTLKTREDVEKLLGLK